MISSLTISLGLFYLLMAAIASWLLRTSAASLVVKISVPVLIVVLACGTYLTLPDAFGYPVETTMSRLPQQAELIAFVSYDGEKKVDLWLETEGEKSPRAYSVELSPALKETLRQARAEKDQGRRAMLAKGGKKSGENHPQYTDNDGGEAPYILLPNAFSLPNKDGQQ